jgi:virulence factor Mce-like protein
MRLSAPARAAGERRGRAFRLTLGLAGIAAGVAMFVIGWSAPNSLPFRSYYTIHAQFREADNLTPHANVRLGGRLIGQVLHPRVSHGLGTVDLQLDPSVKPLLSDTRLIVRPRSAIGNRFVEVIPGGHGRPVPDGGTIPASKTSITVQLDQVFGVFDATTRQRTSTVITQLGEGFADRGNDLNQTIATAPGFLHGTALVTGAIAGRPGAVQRFVEGTAGAASAVALVRNELASGFAPEAQALQPFSTHAASLQATLAKAPADLQGVRAGLAQTDPLISELDGLAHTIQPALAVAPRALTQASQLLTRGGPIVRRADAVLQLTGQAVPPTIGLLRTLMPVLPSLEATLSNSLPIVNELAPRDCDLQLMLFNWEDMMAYGNSDGSFLRFLFTGGQESLAGAGSAELSLPGVYSNPYPAPCRSGTEALG